MEKQGKQERLDRDLKSELFYDFLSSEINHLKDEMQRPGWTKWAIIGGLATLTWLTLNEFANNALINQNNISFIVIGSVFIYNFISLLMYSLGGGPITKPDAKYFMSNQFIGLNRFYLLLHLLQYVVMIFLVSNLLSGLGKQTITLIYILTSLFAFMFLSVLVLSYFRIPFNVSRKSPWKFRIFWFSLVILMLIVILKIFHFYFDHSENFHISDFRISALCLGMFYLTLLLIKKPQHTLMLSSLIEIRRKLIFHNLDIGEAVRQTEIALTGLRASNLLHNFIVNFIKLCDEFNSKIDLLIKKADIWEGLKKKEKSCEMSDSDKEIKESLKDSIKKILGELEDLLSKEIPLALRPIKRRATFLSRLSEQPDDEIAPLIRIMEDASSSMKQRISKAQNKIRSITNKE